MLLPDAHNATKLRNLPLADLPFVAVGGIQVHVVELEDHRELPAVFADVLAGFKLRHSAGHLSNGAAVEFTQCFGIHLVNILMDIRPVCSQHLSYRYRLRIREHLPIREHHQSRLLILIRIHNRSVRETGNFGDEVHNIKLGGLV